MFDRLTERLGDVFGRLTRRGALSEADVDAALREVRVALLEADVALPVVKDFLAKVREGAVGETVFDPVNSALNQSAYGLLSARFGYEREHFGIFLFGENLTDTEYFTKKVSSLNAGAPGQPQIFGIEATARY